jgi:hypothetical protein
LFGYLVLLFFQFASWKNNRAIIHDVTSYYGYLPAAFIFDDLNFRFAENLPADEPKDLLWFSTLPGGQRFQKMTLGLAYFYSPTFVVAHIYTYFDRKWNRNGFSFPYQFALALNTLLVGLLSLQLMRKILNIYFNDKLTALLLIICFAATNLPYYISVSPGTSHIYSFLLVCAIILIILRFNEQPNLSKLIILSLCVSLIVLIRPTNLFLALIPVFICSYSKITVIFRNYKFGAFLILAACILPWIPQLIYWKQVTDQWIFYTYGNEQFYFSDPKVWEGLFGFRKGWFVYSPALLILIPALVFNIEKLRSYRLFFIITFPVFVYVVFSWWCWWYGGSFGSRTMIEYYPICLILIGGFLYRLSNKRILKGVLILFWCFCIYLNNYQMRQYQRGILHWDSMTYLSYKAIFLSNRLPSNYKELLESPDYKKTMQGKGR